MSAAIITWPRPEFLHLKLHCPTPFMMESFTQNEIIQFMFRRKEDDCLDVMQCLNLWFGKSNGTDAEICTRFGPLVHKALEGGLDSWLTTPKGCLALMILIDQFPRNMFRHTVKSFAGDRRARRLVDAGHDWINVLRPEECIFLPCLILTHQECPDDQKQCVDFYGSLEKLLPTELHIFRTIFEEHKRIIDICGHFPHRDHYYNRETSDVGKAIMENSKVRFDLPLICENGVTRFGRDSTKLWRSTELAFDIIDRIDALVGKSLARRSSIVAESNMAELSMHQVAEYREIFQHFDRDGSGSIEVHELAQVLTSVSGHSSTVLHVQNAVDTITGHKNSTSVSFRDFVALMKIPVTNDWEARLRRRFDMFDVDGSGEIDLQELVTCIRHLDNLITLEDIAKMMQTCDLDGSGTISYKEFEKMIPMIVGAREAGFRRASLAPGSDEISTVSKSVFDSTGSSKTGVVASTTELVKTDGSTI